MRNMLAAYSELAPAVVDAPTKTKGERDSYDQETRTGACEGNGSWCPLESRFLV